GTVVLSLALHYGSVKSLQGQNAVSDLAIDMLPRGTEQHTRQQFKDELEKLKARLSIGGGGGSLNARIETVRESLPGTMRLLAEALRQPTFPAAELEQLRHENLAGIEQQRTDPGSMAGTAYARHQHPYPRGDPRYAAEPDELMEEYKAATLEQVKDFYRRFLGGARGELAVVGEFDAKEVEALSAELFADWA